MSGGNSPIETERVHRAYLTKQKHQIQYAAYKFGTGEFEKATQTNLRVAKVVSKSLQSICSKIVFIPQHVIVSRTACTLCNTWFTSMRM